MKRFAALFALLAVGLARAQYVPLRVGVIHQAGAPSPACTVGASPAIFAYDTGCLWYCAGAAGPGLGIYAASPCGGSSSAAAGSNGDVQVFVNGVLGTVTGLNINLSTGALSSPSFVGPLVGNASTATSATTATTATNFTGTLAGDVGGTQGATTIGASKVTSAMIVNGTIVSADLSGSAGITDAQVSDTLTCSILATGTTLPAGALDNATDVATTLCSDGQILKKVSGAWACGTDDTLGSGAVTLTGSPLAQQLALWTGTSTVGGYPDLTVNPSTHVVTAPGFVGPLTGTASLATTVTTNANMTGPITSVGNATTIADAELAALAGLASQADRVPYFTGSGAAALATMTTQARALLDDVLASDQRSTLGLGSLATQSTLTSLADHGDLCAADQVVGRNSTDTANVCITPSAGTGTPGVGLVANGGALDFAPTEMNSFTWGDNSQATNTYTFNVSGGGTDPTLSVTQGTGFSTNAPLTVGGGVNGTHGILLDGNTATLEDPGTNAKATFGFVGSTGAWRPTVKNFGGANYDVLFGNGGDYGDFTCLTGSCVLDASGVGAGSFTNASVTVDTKGRVTAISSGSSSGITDLVAATDTDWTTYAGKVGYVPAVNAGATGLDLAPVLTVTLTTPAENDVLYQDATGTYVNKPSLLTTETSPQAGDLLIYQGTGATGTANKTVSGALTINSSGVTALSSFTGAALNAAVSDTDVVTLDGTAQTIASKTFTLGSTSWWTFNRSTTTGTTNSTMDFQIGAVKRMSIGYGASAGAYRPWVVWDQSAGTTQVAYVTKTGVLNGFDDTTAATGIVPNLGSNAPWTGAHTNSNAAPMTYTVGGIKYGAGADANYTFETYDRAGTDPTVTWTDAATSSMPGTRRNFLNQNLALDPIADGSVRGLYYPVTTPVATNMLMGSGGATFNGNLDNVLCWAYNTDCTGVRTNTSEYSINETFEGSYDSSATAGRQSWIERNINFTTAGGVSWRPSYWVLDTTANSGAGGATWDWIPNNLNSSNNRSLHAAWPSLSTGLDASADGSTATAYGFSSWARSANFAAQVAAVASTLYLNHTDDRSSYGFTGVQASVDFNSTTSAAKTGNTVAGSFSNTVSGSATNRTEGQINGIDSSVNLTSSGTGTSIPYSLGVSSSFNPTGSNITMGGYADAFRVPRPGTPGSSTTVAAYYGLYIEDLGLDRAGYTAGSAIRIDSQTTTDGSEGNFWMTGGDHNTGHIRLGDTHIFANASDGGRVRIATGIGAVGDNGGSSVVVCSAQTVLWAAASTDCTTQCAAGGCGCADAYTVLVPAQVGCSSTTAVRTCLCN